MPGVPWSFRLKGAQRGMNYNQEFLLEIKLQD